MYEINENMLKAEFKFQQNFIKKEDNNFLLNFKEYLNEYKDFFNTELYKNSGNYLYFSKYVNINLKKSVLIVIHELSRTGAPVVAVDTAKILKDNGYFVTVITMKGGNLLDDLINYGIPVIIMNEFRYMQYVAVGVESFTEFLDLDFFINSFDIIIMITATLYNLVRRYMNSGKKIYWWIHEGTETYNIIGNKMPRYITPSIKVLCGGEYSAKQLIDRRFGYYPEVLNYGVKDIGKLQNKKVANKITFLLAGTLSTRKGQLLLLEAIKRLSKKNMKKAEFIFIGDPYENDNVGKMIKESIEEFCNQNNNVKLFSSISRDELFKLYGKIDVLVLASTDDPMPVVATENLMLGNIVLCSTGTGTSYYITDKKNGFIFNNGRADELAEKISYIIENKNKLDNIKNEGRKVFETYFDMPIFIDNLLQIVEEN